MRLIPWTRRIIKELEERIKQVALEADNWHYRAKYNNVVAPADHGKEGFGDSEVDDAAHWSKQQQHGYSEDEIQYVVEQAVRYKTSEKMS